jgi:NAD-dependent dihydropyrimidine dehydrogenase PreA subunit
MAAPTINADECVGCESCVDACPNGVLEMADGVAVVANPDDCIECEICVGECSVDAITM